MKRAIFNQQNQIFLMIASLLVLFGVVLRFLPHPPNFVPIGAIALFAGMYLPKRWFIIVPILAMIISDFFIGFYSWKLMLAVYGSFTLMGIIGLWIRQHKRFSTILGGTLLGPVLFFLIVNAAVWAFGSMYTHDLSGLLQSYIMAIPFFRNSLLGNLFYVGVLVGGVELVRYWVVSRKHALAFSKQTIHL